VPRDARVLAQRLTFLTDIAFALRMEHGMAIEPQIMERYLQELGRFLVEAAGAARAVAPQMTAETAAYEATCSQAAIDALRHALYLRGPARRPLRDVANRLDFSEENARRDAGMHDAPSPFLRSGRADNRVWQDRLLTRPFDRIAFVKRLPSQP